MIGQEVIVKANLDYTYSNDILENICITWQVAVRKFSMTAPSAIKYRLLNRHLIVQEVIVKI